MISAACERPDHHLNDGRATAAITSALADQQVDRALWTPIRYVYADSQYFSLLESLQRTPDLLESLQGVTVYADGKDGRLSVPNAKRAAQLIRPQLPPSLVNAYIASSIVALTESDDPHCGMQLPRWLATTPAEVAATAIIKNASENQVHELRSDCQKVLADPLLTQHLLEYFTNRLVAGDASAGTWLHALAESHSFHSVNN